MTSELTGSEMETVFLPVAVSGSTVTVATASRSPLSVLRYRKFTCRSMPWKLNVSMPSHSLFRFAGRKYCSCTVPLPAALAAITEGTSRL